MNVAELLGTLGLKVDTATFLAANEALRQVEERTQAATDATRLSAAITNQIGSPAKAAALIGFGDAAAGAMGKATKGGIDWGRAMVVANQALEVGAKIYGGLARGVGFMRGMVEATGAQAAQAVELAMRLGISAEAVQEIGFAASQSGSSVEEMADGMRNLANQVDGAAKGGKEASRSLRAVGLTVAEVRAGGLDGALGKIADKFAAMEDGQKKSALAVDLFGKSGAKLIPLLNEGSAGIGRLRQEARDLGIVIDNETAAAMEGFGDETDKVKAQLEGVRNQAIAALLPALTEMVKGLQAWVATNRQLLIGALTTALQVFVGVLRAVGVVIEYVIHVGRFYADHLEILIPLLLVLAGAVTYFGIAAAAAWIMALGPVGLVILAVTALILLMPVIVKGAQAAGRAIARVANSIADAFRDAWRSIGDGFNAVGRFFGNILDGIKSAFKSAVDWIVARIDTVIGVFNKAIRAYNSIPMLGDIGEISTIGSDPRKATAAPGRVAVVRQESTINVNAPNADTEQVKAAVRENFRHAFDAEVTGAFEGLG